MNDKKQCNKVSKAAEKASAPEVSESITAENVIEIGERVAVKALKTCYQASGARLL